MPEVQSEHSKKASGMSKRRRKKKEPSDDGKSPLQDILIWCYICGNRVCSFHSTEWRDATDDDNARKVIHGQDFNGMCDHCSNSDDKEE